MITLSHFPYYSIKRFQRKVENGKKAKARPFAGGLFGYRR